MADPASVNLLLVALRTPPAIRPQAILLGKLLRHLPAEGVRIGLLTPSETDAVAGVELLRYRELSGRVQAAVAKLTLSNIWLRTAMAHRSALRVARNASRSRRFDLVMSFANPYSTNIIGALVAERENLPLIAHYSDPFVDSPFQIVPEHVRRGRLSAERRVLQRAEHVVFVNRQLRDWVLDRHDSGLVKNTHIIPHSYEAALFPRDAGSRSDGKVIFRHIGALYGPRDGCSLLDALVLLRQRKPDLLKSVMFEFVGPDLYGAGTPFSAEVARRELNDPVRIESVVPYAESLAKMCAADVLVNIDAGTGAAIFLPSKLIEYLGARRPILCLTQPGSPAHEFCQAAGGLTANVNKPDEIAVSIEKVALDRKILQPAEAMLSAYSVQSIARDWAGLFAHVVSGVRRGV
jgi:hypothetical protein